MKWSYRDLIWSVIQKYSWRVWGTPRTTVSRLKFEQVTSWVHVRSVNPWNQPAKPHSTENCDTYVGPIQLSWFFPVLGLLRTLKARPHYSCSCYSLYTLRVNIRVFTRQSLASNWSSVDEDLRAQVKATRVSRRAQAWRARALVMWTGLYRNYKTQSVASEAFSFSFREVKWLGREADHSPLSSGRGQEWWSYTPTSSHVFMAWCTIWNFVRAHPVNVLFSISSLLFYNFCQL
jgi:hypothetical protein